MPEATSHLTPSRRDFIGGATAGLLAGLPVAASALAAADHPDAELIALGAEYCELEKAYARLCWADDDCDKRPGKAAAVVFFKATCARMEVVCDAIIDATPMTLEGYRAKARAARANLRDEPEPGSDGEAILYSMICDLLDGEG